MEYKHSDYFVALRKPRQLVRFAYGNFDVRTAEDDKQPERRQLDARHEGHDVDDANTYVVVVQQVFVRIELLLLACKLVQHPADLDYPAFRSERG